MPDNPKLNRPERISRKAFKALSDAVQLCKDEGVAVWGFMFKDEDKHGNVATLDIFTNHADDPLPLFIVKTREALTVIRNRVPEGFNLEEQEQVVAETIADRIKNLPDAQIQPHKTKTIIH